MNADLLPRPLGANNGHLIRPGKKAPVCNRVSAHPFKIGSIVRLSARVKAIVDAYQDFIDILFLGESSSWIAYKKGICGSRDDVISETHMIILEPKIPIGREHP